jgi:hypothetical protein
LKSCTWSLHLASARQRKLAQVPTVEEWLMESEEVAAALDAVLAGQ